VNERATPGHIFREYDIRGLAEKELTDETSRLIGQAFGTFLVRAKKKKIAIGHDLRPTSERINKALILGLLSTGIEVLDLGLIPTPLLYFGVVYFKTDAGISITGSHNPPEYNGFKFQMADRPFYGTDIRQLAERIGKKDFVTGKGTLQSADVLQPYLSTLKGQFRFKRKWKVVIDSGHGMAGLVAPRLFKDLGQEVVELYTNLDPTFPDHHPDPSVLENLKDLSREVVRTKAVLGIAFDGDADRIGVVDEKGNPLLGDRLLLIYARQILKKKKDAAIIGDVKCSPLLYEDIRRRGGRPILWKTGHSLIKAKMKEEKAALGGEMSGHMFFADRWFGFDDAIYAACRAVEILDEEAQPFSELLADLPKVVSTPEIRVEVSDDKKKFEIVRSVVADLKKDYKVLDIDGARIEFSDGWGLIRASNTQPVLAMRFEANSEKRLAEIRAIIETKVKKYGGLK